MPLTHPVKKYVQCVFLFVDMARNAYIIGFNDATKNRGCNMTRNQIIKEAAKIEDSRNTSEEIRAAANRLSNYACESSWTIKILSQRLSELRRGVVTI